MQFTAIIMAALATSVFAVIQDCGRAGLDPYCCSSVNTNPFGEFAVGYNCMSSYEPDEKTEADMCTGIKAKRGLKTRCPSTNQQKQCCEQNASTFVRGLCTR